MNKKAQGAFSTAKVHPILIAGIIVYITPLVLNAMGMKVWGFVGNIGFALIIIGVIVSFVETVG